jgi:hypothetical protein
LVIRVVDGQLVLGTGKAEDDEKPETAGKPFGDYADMAACVADNQNKDDPEAYCAELERVIAEAGEEGAGETAEKRLSDDVRTGLQGAIRSRFGDRSWVMDYDHDAKVVYFERGGMDEASSGKTYSLPYVDGDDITLSDEEPVEVVRETQTTYVPKGQQRGELTGPIVFKQAKKQIAYAAVLVPGEEDSDGEVLTAEKIEEVAHGWMATYRNIDLSHTLNNVDALPVESQILRMAEKVKIDGEDQVLPKGTWVLASKFADKEVWKGIEDGTYGGYSVMGVKRTVATKSSGIALKKTLLEDLGDDWIATHVSVVDMPAVPKAKWFAIKSAKVTFLDKFRMAYAQKEGRKFSAKTLNALRQAHEALAVLIDEANREVDAKSQTKKSATDLDGVILTDDVATKVRTAIRGG